MTEHNPTVWTMREFKLQRIMGPDLGCQQYGVLWAWTMALAHMECSRKEDATSMEMRGSSNNFVG